MRGNQWTGLRISWCPPLPRGLYAPYGERAAPILLLILISTFGRAAGMDRASGGRPAARWRRPADRVGRLSVAGYRWTRLRAKPLASSPIVVMVNL